MDPLELQKDFFSQVKTPVVFETLFDHLTDLVFFIKNSRAQYMVVNQTLVNRCAKQNKGDLIGRTTDEIFPAPLGDSFRSQDDRVLQLGESVLNRLELHLYPSQGTGWCLTNKVPIYDENSHVIGLAGVSKDLLNPRQKDVEFSQIAEIVGYIQTHYHQPLKVDTLADRTGPPASWAVAAMRSC